MRHTAGYRAERNMCSVNGDIKPFSGTLRLRIKTMDMFLEGGSLVYHHGCAAAGQQEIYRS